MLALPFMLGACVGGPGEWASDESVSRALYSDPGPEAVTLMTVINKRTGAGDHSALIVNGEHRILYDPSGTWHNRHAPRRNDVHYGFVPQLEEYYLDYHARETHHVVAQTLHLSEAQAAAAMDAATSLSRAGPGQCAVRTGGILRSVPGLESLPGTFFPRTLMEAFGEVPGVDTRIVEDADVSGQVTVSEAELRDGA